MKRNSLWIAVFMLIVCLQLSACSQAPEAAEASKPVRLEPVNGTNLNHVILTEDAAKRLDIQTSPVRDEVVDGKKRLVVPYAAVLYGPNGETWVYVTIEPLVFVRQAILVDLIEGDNAFLSDGPGSGTAVVTTGAVELFGSESEFAEE
jgi:hypothetical protein